ncbi:hypothetical protein HELRODRAFT_194236 [Helobdella robusta]|uniref:Uncharacterized protein n=1 Tax=Helobdella robusta TaxID=6412 RepID=T1FVU5_HELRO|nr:hypothetical protein HELRODRAFT_194236 [Helobdella robusta]ESN92379.1 hypothetical protein HELRODRAFT_194236 [Helobdella robusta]
MPYLLPWTRDTEEYIRRRYLEPIKIQPNNSNNDCSKNNNNNSNSTSIHNNNNNNMNNNMNNNRESVNDRDPIYEAMKTNYEYIIEDGDSPTRCLLPGSPASCKTQLLPLDSLSFSNFSSGGQNSNNNNINNNNNRNGSMFRKRHNPLYITTYDDLLLSGNGGSSGGGGVGYYKNNPNSNFLPYNGWPHSATMVVLSTILVLSLLAIILSSFCLYKLNVIGGELTSLAASIEVSQSDSSYNISVATQKLNDVNESLVSKMEKVEKYFGLKVSVNLSLCIWSKREVNSIVQDDVIYTGWVPDDDDSKKSVVTGASCSSKTPGLKVSMEDDNVSRVRCSCSGRPSGYMSRNCVVHFWYCPK